MKKEKPKYLKFSRSFEKGGVAPWLVGYMEKDKEEVKEIFFVCDKCKKRSQFDIDDKTNIAKLVLEQEQLHKKCGLN